jgi:hypothetical protein
MTFSAPLYCTHCGRSARMFLSQAASGPFPSGPQYDGDIASSRGVNCVQCHTVAAISVLGIMKHIVDKKRKPPAPWTTNTSPAKYVRGVQNSGQMPPPLTPQQARLSNTNYEFRTDPPTETPSSITETLDVFTHGQCGICSISSEAPTGDCCPQ